jgi:1-pyrroline-5-carboxylate dehydrogenase
MQFGYFNYPMPANETVLSYAPGSPEKTALKKALADLKKKTLDIPMYIGGSSYSSAP